MPSSFAQDQSNRLHDQGGQDPFRLDSEAERARPRDEASGRQDAKQQAHKEGTRAAPVNAHARGSLSGGSSAGRSDANARDGQKIGSSSTSRDADAGLPRPGRGLDRFAASSAPALDVGSGAHALGASPASEDLRRWVSAPDLGSPQQRKPSAEQNVKSKLDPRKAFKALVSARTKKKQHRERAMERALAHESSDAPSTESGPSSDQNNRDAARMAQKRRRDSGTSSRHQEAGPSSDLQSDFGRPEKRRALDDAHALPGDAEPSSSRYDERSHDSRPSSALSHASLEHAASDNELMVTVDVSRPTMNLWETAGQARADEFPSSPASALSSGMDFSFPPCAQPIRTGINTFAVASSNFPSHSMFVPVPGDASVPSSSLERIKEEHDCDDDTPIAELVSAAAGSGEAGEDGPSGTRSRSSTGASQIQGSSPSKTGQASSSVKAEPRADDLIPGSGNRTGPDTSSLAHHGISSAGRPEDQVNESDSGLPSVKVEGPTGSQLLRSSERDELESSSLRDAARALPQPTVKAEVLSQQLPPRSSGTQSSMGANESPLARMTAARFREAEAEPEIGDDDEAHNQTMGARPLTLLHAQRSGLIPNPWQGQLRNDSLMPSMTQGSEWDELVSSCSQITYQGPSTQTELVGGTSALATAAGVEEVSTLAPGTQGEEEMQANPTSEAMQAETANEGGEVRNEASAVAEPQRSQQQAWNTGIWHSQLPASQVPVIPNAFQRMQMMPRSVATAAAPGQATETGEQHPDDSAIVMPDFDGEIDDEALIKVVEAAEAEAEIRIRESMYPAALKEMIDTVLAEEEFLFSRNEAAFLKSYSRLSEQARHLFSRLIQRKHKWYRVKQLKYEPYVRDTLAAVKELARARMELEAQHSQHVCDPTTAGESLLIRFVETQHETDLHEKMPAMLQLLSSEELKDLARQMNIFKASLSTRAALIEALLAAKNQSTLAGIGSGRAGGSPRKPGPGAAFSISASPTKLLSSATPSASPSKRDRLRQLQLNFDFNGNKAAQSSMLKTKVRNIIEDVVYVPGAVRSLIDRVALVYYRGNIHNSVGGALSQAILSRCGRRNYPQVEVKRSPDLFKSREQLKRYERACALDYKMVLLVDGSFEVSRVAGASAETYIGQSAYNAHEEELPQAGSEQAIQGGIDLFEEVFQEWKDAVAECEAESPDGGDRITYHRRRFHPGWPLTRIIYKALMCFARLKQYEREKEVLNALLKQRVFCRGKRGDWYERLALILGNYSPDKNKGKRDSLAKACEGLEDPDTHLIYHHALRKRIIRLESQIRMPFKEKHQFDAIQLKECKHIEINGVRLDRMAPPKPEPRTLFFGAAAAKAGPSTEGRKRTGSPQKSGSISPGRQSPGKESGSSRLSKRPSLRKEVTVERIVDPEGKGKQVFRSPSADSLLTPPVEEGDAKEQLQFEAAGKEFKTDMHTTWRGLDGAPCRVETYCLQYFAKEGFEGVHDEGGVLTMLFVLAMWDVIFMPIEGAFETKYQREPLDMRSDAFAIVRRAEVNARLTQISNGDAVALIRATDERERPRKTYAAGCRWDDYSREQLLQIAECLGGGPFSTVCKMFCEEWEHCQSGMPDLCMWRYETKEVRFVEVKGPGDQLRQKQLVWIDELVRAGARVQVAKVKDRAAMEAPSKREGGSKAPKK